MATTLTFKAKNPDTVIREINTLIDSLSGRDTHTPYFNAFQKATLTEIFTQVGDEFVKKSTRAQDKWGLKWPELAPLTIKKRIERGLKRGPRPRPAALTKPQKERFRRVFEQEKKKLKPRGLHPATAQSLAIKRAWDRVGGSYKTAFPIGIETEDLVRSLTLGNRYTIRRFRDGALEAGTRRPWAERFANGGSDPPQPPRPIFPSGRHQKKLTADGMTKGLIASAQVLKSRIT